MEEKLDLTSLEKAIDSLGQAMDKYEANKDDYMRDACIQRFEYCYELGTKMLRRHLANISENPSSVKVDSFQNIIRQGYKKQVLKHSWDTWIDYREKRNKTSHGYNENVAKDVVEIIPDFFIEVSLLLNKLKDHYETEL